MVGFEEKLSIGLVNSLAMMKQTTNDTTNVTPKSDKNIRGSLIVSLNFK